MQIFKLLLFSILLVLMADCKTDHGIKKKYLIDRETLVNVLVDIHLANALQGSPEYYNISRMYDSIDINSRIFNKHGIEKASFDSTIAYYTKKPEILTKIYDEVIMRLTQIQDSIKLE
jgi:hypothetical protein